MRVWGVTESAVQYLRERIITGELKPGQRLNEQEMAEKLGISRPPLREALRTLTEDYLVTSVPRRGASVTKLSIHDLREIYSARHMVETYAIDIMDEKNIREVGPLRDSVEHTSILPPPPAADSNGWLAYWRAFSDFHYKLVELAQNMFLLKFYKVIGYNLARYQVLYLKLSGSDSQSFSDHQQIVEMLEDGRYVQAKELLVKHLARTHRRLEESIRGQVDMTQEAISA